MKTKVLTLCVVLCSAYIFAAAPEVVWSKDTLSLWRANKNVKYKVENNISKLFEIGRDYSIKTDNLNIEPEKYNFISYKYRSVGNTSRSGQLFWTAPGERFSEKRKLLLPSLKADGKWHTAIAWFSRLPQPEVWSGCGKVTSLRFDPSDNAGGLVEIAEIKLGFADDKAGKSAVKKVAFASKPLPRFVPKTDVPAWKKVTPAFFPEPAEVKVDGVYFQAKMIQVGEDLSPDEAQVYARSAKRNIYTDFFLRKDFELKSKPVKAFLQFVADDSATVYINGKAAGTVKSWYNVEVLDVEQYLASGKNVLAFHYCNSGNAGGVLAELFVQYSDGTFERINTDEGFVGTISPQDDWSKIGAATGYFKKVDVFGAPPTSPWRKKLVYKDFSLWQNVVGKAIMPQQVYGGEKVTLKFDFQGNIPKLPFTGDVKIFRDKHLLWHESVTVTEKNIQKAADKNWKLQFDYVLPMYFSSNDLTLEFQSGSICVDRSSNMVLPFKLIACKSIPGFEKECRSLVRTGNYGPYFEINGSPFFHVAGENNTFPKGEPPVNIIEVPTVFNEWWTPENEFVFEAFDTNAEAVRRISKDAYFFMNISLSIPRKWLQEHPDAICLDDRGNIVRDGYGSIRDSHSFGSKEVLAEMRKAMIKALEHLEKSPYANRIAGYRIVGGHTIEWLGWSPIRGRGVDFSLTSKQAFKDFALKNYPELKDHSIPSVEARKAMDNGEILWEPAKHLNAIAFNDFYSNAVVDYVIELCSAAKKVLQNKKLVGSYYGYTMTLNENSLSQLRAHFALKKILDANCVDFLMSPQPYNVRNFGDTYGDMKPFASLKNHNIVAVQEDDTRTNFSRGGVGGYQAPNTELCVEILRRSMAFNLCRNMPILFITQPGHYEDEQIREDFKTAQIIGQHCLEKQTARRAETVLVVSEKSISYSPANRPFIKTGYVEQIYMPDGSIRINPMTRSAFNYDAYGRIYTTMAQVGVPVDYMLAEDLADNPGDYKLYIFTNCNVYDRKFLKAVEKLRQKNCTLVWMYAPGYTFENVNSVENMQQLTDLKFKKLPVPVMPALKTARGWVGSPTARIAPMFAVTDPAAEVFARYEDGNAGFISKQTGKAKTFFVGIWRPDVQLLSSIAASAGVKIYCENGDPLEANDALITLHGRSAGKKTVKLFKKTDVLDVFNKKIIARNTDNFTIDLKLHESALFYYGNDVDKVLKKLERKK